MRRTRDACPWVELVMPGPDPGIQSRHGDAVGNYFVYIMASRKNGTLYIGVTSDYVGRVPEHKQDLFEGFTKRYGVHRLVYIEFHDDMTTAIRREKQLKRWKRAWKIALIEKTNPDWRDLFFELSGLKDI